MVGVKLYGGVGNNLFQMATCIAYSLKHNMVYCIPTWVENPHYKDQKTYIFTGVKYCDKELIFGYQYNEQKFHYEEIPYHESILLNGFFQSEKYFSGYRKKILEAFDIPYEFKEGYVAIHVRRGDYLLYSHCHKVVTPAYLIAAIIYMKESGYDKFIFFSDDIDWCKKLCNSFNLNIQIKFSEGRTELEDLALASSCEHSIGSASSFSYWIYWLNQNKNKIGVFPKKSEWFGPALPHNVDDLYNDKWVLI